MANSSQTEGYIILAQEIIFVTTEFIHVWTTEGIYISLPNHIICLYGLQCILNKNCLVNNGCKITVCHHFT